MIVKHANPCGVAVAGSIEEAYERALAADPVSAYGGMVVLNRPVSEALGEKLAEQFVEVLFAPGYDEAALELLTQKPATRILDDQERRRDNPGERDLKRVLGGLLVQDRDSDVEDREGMEVVCGSPSEMAWGDLLFAWRVCKHVSSNAIVLAKDLQTIGIGAGQMSRVDSVRIALEKAREHGHPTAGAVLASDAFFPFADGPAARAGRGRDGRDPAGRLEARRRGDRGGRASRRDDGLHASPPLPALMDVELRNRIYVWFVEHGEAPSMDEVGGDETALQRLHDAHALVLEPGSTEIRMLNPFSAVPTAYRVEAAGRSWYGNCVWDAFGVPAALGVDGHVSTACSDGPMCGNVTRARISSTARTNMGLCRRPTHRPNRRPAFWQFKHPHVQEAEPLVQCRATLAAGLEVRR